MSAFVLRPGVTVYDSSGMAVSLEREIGRGGEGSVWSIQGDQRFAAKFYHKGMAAAHAQKLALMCRLKSESLLKIAAWPVSTLHVNRVGKPEGLLMPLISGYQAAHLLYNPKSRRSNFPDAQFPFIVHSANNIARAFATIHDAGQVIGDVNHGNLLVSEQAIVKLIDCDSFEIADQTHVYPCLVGVPPYTPPELQGKKFEEVRRTKQHDAFGLAVLIFHMLFLGRHPFAGIYQSGTSDMTIEQAISEYRSAYSLDTSVTQMQPPPSAPRLSDFPPTLSDFFIRAFTRVGATGNRPSAHEWIEPLDRLSKSLRQCGANRSHHFPNHLTACPWCRVERMVGIPMFGIRIDISATDQFNIAAVWKEIEAVQPVPEAVIPTSQNFVGSLTVNVKIGEIVTQRRLRRLLWFQSVATTIAIVIGIVIAAQPESILTMAASITLLGLGVYGGAKTISAASGYGISKLWGSGKGKEFADAYQAAMKEYTAAKEEWARIKSSPVAFTQTKEQLTAAKAMFQDIPALRTRKTAELNATRRQKQFQHFLENHRIEDATLPGIGKGRKELLRVYNVEDAADVVMSKISNIKGFGPTMRTTLLTWRNSVEQQFQFEPSQGIDPRDLRALEQEIEQRRAGAIRLLTNGRQMLQQSLDSWHAQQGPVMENLARSARRLAQAELDIKALRGK